MSCIFDYLFFLRVAQYLYGPDKIPDRIFGQNFPEATQMHNALSVQMNVLRIALLAIII